MPRFCGNRPSVNNDAKLQDVFVDVLAIDPAEYSDDLGQDNVGTWDSMAMVSLIAEIEDAFDLELDLLEFSRFVSVGSIKGVLREHGVAFGSPEP
jgi:acyl carrier protein